MQLSKFFIPGLCLLLALSSCNSSKIAFGNSYYFKQTPKEITKKMAEVPPVESVDFTASAPQEQPALANRQPLAVPQPLAEAAIQYEQVNKALEQEDLSKQEKKSLKAEQKAQKKIFKKEFKKFAEKAKAQKEAVQDDVEGLVKAGLIVGAAGLVMLVIGVATAGGAVLTTLGGIFLAVGLVLILLQVL